MNYEQRELQSIVEDAAACSGAGTELVTVWIPAGKNVASVRDRLRGERAEAQNIKSKRTRDRVSGALERTLNMLHKYDSTPKNGLILCAGFIDTTGEYVEFEFNDLPEPIRDSKYECSDTFAVEGLLDIAFGGADWWGLVTVTRDSASIGRYTNNSRDYVDVIDAFESQVMGKSKAGGQSQARFRRLREEQRREHYKKAATIVVNSFPPDDEMFRGFAVGGPNVTVSDFIDYLPERLQEEIITVETVDHAGSREALVELARLSESAFNETEREEERKLVQQFKRGLTGDGAVSYGHDEVMRAIEYGAVDTLLVSADLSTTYIDEMRSSVEGQGGSLVVVSSIHDEGGQLSDVFGGLAALLRYPIT